MFYKLKNTLGRSAYALSTRAILDTAPVSHHANAGFALLSQIRHDDVRMYLVAVKSFAYRLPPAAVVVVDDGSLTQEDHSLLKKHIPGCQVVRAAENRLEGCPQGGTWERLIAISKLVKDFYVIQLDADTVTLNAIPEVARCVSENRSFCIGTWDNQEPETMQERIEVARRHIDTPRPHVQLLAEAKMDALPGHENLTYIRGCSGFSGFAKGSFTPSKLANLSAQMAHALGERWTDWGTEQFMSNVIVANSDRPFVLPHPKYCDCTRYVAGLPAFVHFIGTCRFSQGKYAEASRKLIAQLGRHNAVGSCPAAT